MSNPTQRWLLATSSYRDHRPEMGVPVGTSVGRHPQFQFAPEVWGLKPFGVFGVMSEAPIHVQRTAYQSRLHRYARSIERALDVLTVHYRGQQLCLLCWCGHDLAARGECHRRWAADWFLDVYGVEVPESDPSAVRGAL